VKAWLWLAAACVACTGGQLDAFDKASDDGEPAPGPNTAGTAGTAGSGHVLLDDFEDGDKTGMGATEDWYIVNDFTGTQSYSVELAESGSGVRAMRTRGQGFSDWGAKLGLDLSVEDQPFDATGYGYVSFLARHEAGTLSEVRLVLLDHQAYYGKDLELTESWQKYTVRFSELTRPDGTSGLDPSRLRDLQFFTEPRAPFDYWIDLVELQQRP
jgi:hypothetical protein